MRFSSLTKKRAGLSLTEVVVMVMIVAMTITMATSLLISTIQTTQSNRNSVVAENLAVEAVDATYNLIQTNILRYGRENITECWFVYTQNVPFADACIGQEILTSGAGNQISGRLTRAYDVPDLHWQYSNSLAPLDLSQPEFVSNDQYRLYEVKLDPSSEFLGNTIYYSHAQPEGATISPFYREIVYRAVDNGAAQLDEIEFEVKVQWLENDRVRSVQKTGSINYLNF